MPDLDDNSRRALLDLVDRVTRARGASPLGEQARVELAGNADAASFFALVAQSSDAGGPVGYAHLDPPPSGPAGGTWTVALAVDETSTSPVSPGSDGSPPPAAGPGLLDAAVTTVEQAGGDAVRLWVTAATADDDQLAADAGFHLERELLQMRCPLPLPDPPAGGDRGPAVTTRAFRPGLDEDAWLLTNNRAFAGHPEQGGWDRPTLEAREREPWFDADGFRVLEEDGAVTGFCWTKIHRDEIPALGEIYVIGVDPSATGRGLGRALVRDGLAWLSTRGIRHGLLYVDADNLPAVHLYGSLGFVEHHVDRAYLRPVGP
jgi:mycothiol synthase